MAYPLTKSPAVNIPTRENRREVKPHPLNIPISVGRSVVMESVLKETMKADELTYRELAKV